MESGRYVTHQARITNCLENILIEASGLLSLPSTPDFRHHVIITLSRTVKQRVQKLFGVFISAMSDAGGGASRGVKGDVSGDGVKGEGDGDKRLRKLEKEAMLDQCVKKIMKTANSLRKEVYTVYMCTCT